MVSRVELGDRDACHVLDLDRVRNESGSTRYQSSWDKVQHDVLRPSITIYFLLLNQWSPIESIENHRMQTYCFWYDIQKRNNKNVTSFHQNYLKRTYTHFFSMFPISKLVQFGTHAFGMNIDKYISFEEPNSKFCRIRNLTLYYLCMVRNFQNIQPMFEIWRDLLFFSSNAT